MPCRTTANWSAGPALCGGQGLCLARRITRAVKARPGAACQAVLSDALTSRAPPPAPAGALTLRARGMSASTAQSSALRLMSDLKTMKQSPPEGVSASPMSEEQIVGTAAYPRERNDWILCDACD